MEGLLTEGAAGFRKPAAWGNSHGLEAETTRGGPVGRSVPGRRRQLQLRKEASHPGWRCGPDSPAPPRGRLPVPASRRPGRKPESGGIQEQP